MKSGQRVGTTGHNNENRFVFRRKSRTSKVKPLNNPMANLFKMSICDDYTYITHSCRKCQENLTQYEDARKTLHSMKMPGKPYTVWRCQENLTQYEDARKTLHSMKMPGKPYTVWRCQENLTQYEDARKTLHSMKMPGKPYTVWRCQENLTQYEDARKTLHSMKMPGKPYTVWRCQENLTQYEDARKTLHSMKMLAGKRWRYRSEIKEDVTQVTMLYQTFSWSRNRFKIRNLSTKS